MANYCRAVTKSPRGTNRYKFLISYTGGSTKKTGNLYFVFEKADSNPPPQKKESTRKKVNISAPNPPKLCLWTWLKRVNSFPYFFILNTGSVQNIIFLSAHFSTLLVPIAPSPIIWAGSRAGSPVSVSLVLTLCLDIVRKAAYDPETFSESLLWHVPHLGRLSLRIKKTLNFMLLSNSLVPALKNDLSKS